MPYFEDPWVHTGLGIMPVNVSDDDLSEGKIAKRAVQMIQTVAAKRLTGEDIRPMFLAVGFRRCVREGACGAGRH